jgi:hypothetical protein
MAPKKPYIWLLIPVLKGTPPLFPPKGPYEFVDEAKVMELTTLLLLPLMLVRISPLASGICENMKFTSEFVPLKAAKPLSYVTCSTPKFYQMLRIYTYINKHYR